MRISFCFHSRLSCMNVMNYRKTMLKIILNNICTFLYTMMMMITIIIIIIINMNINHHVLPYTWPILDIVAIIDVHYSQIFLVVERDLPRSMRIKPFCVAVNENAGQLTDEKSLLLKSRYSQSKLCVNKCETFWLSPWSASFIMLGCSRSFYRGLYATLLANHRSCKKDDEGW